MTLEVVKERVHWSFLGTRGEGHLEEKEQLEQRYRGMKILSFIQKIFIAATMCQALFWAQIGKTDTILALTMFPFQWEEKDNKL